MLFVKPIPKNEIILNIFCFVEQVPPISCLTRPTSVIINLQEPEGRPSFSHKKISFSRPTPKIIFSPKNYLKIEGLFLLHIKRNNSYLSISIFLSKAKSFSSIDNLSEQDHKIIGALGVIGPTRLNYARVIPLVDYTARVVGRLLDTDRT